MSDFLQLYPLTDSIIIARHSLNKLLYRCKTCSTNLLTMSCFNVKQAVSMVCTIIILDIFANTQFFICLLKKFSGQ